MLSGYWGVHARAAPATRVVVEVTYPAAVVESGAQHHPNGSARSRPKANSKAKAKAKAKTKHAKKKARLYAGSPSASGLQLGFHVALVVREEVGGMPRWECAELVGSDGPRDRWRVRFEHSGEVATVELPHTLRRLTWEYSSQFPRSTFASTSPVSARKSRAKLARQAQQRQKVHAAATAVRRRAGAGAHRDVVRDVREADHALDLDMVCTCAACGGNAPPLVYDRSAPSSLVQLRRPGSGGGAPNSLPACGKHRWQVCAAAVPRAITRRALKNGGTTPESRPFVVALFECLKDASAASRYVWAHCAKYSGDFWGAHPGVSRLTSCGAAKRSAEESDLKPGAQREADRSPPGSCQCTRCEHASTERTAYVDAFKLELAAYVDGARLMRLLNAARAPKAHQLQAGPKVAKAVAND